MSILLIELRQLSLREYQLTREVILILLQDSHLELQEYPHWFQQQQAKERKV